MYLHNSSSTDSSSMVGSKGVIFFVYICLEVFGFIGFLPSCRVIC